MISWPEFDLFSSYALGMGGLVTGLLGLWADRRSGSHVRTRFGIAAALALGVLAAAFWFLGRPRGLGLTVPLLVVAAGCVLVHAFHSAWLTRAGTKALALARAPRWQWGALALACPLAAYLFANPGHQRAAAVTATPTAASEIPAPFPEMRAVEPGLAFTDGGRPVQLLLPLIKVDVTQTILNFETVQLRERCLLRHLIETAPLDPDSNCHGWVFAGGRFILDNPEVEPILRDNGYTLVDTPRAGDLVMYRDDNDYLVHSGIVRTVVPGGPVLVESKWGLGSRFLHPVKDQPYGTRWTFHRSDRPGHRLRGLED